MSGFKIPPTRGQVVADEEPPAGRYFNGPIAFGCRTVAPIGNIFTQARQESWLAAIVTNARAALPVDPNPSEMILPPNFLPNG
jgi:hypothetical protein